MRFTTTKKKEPEIFKDIDVDENKYFLKINGNSYEDTIQNVANKLGQLEDNEDKLGFGLNELIQMLINGIWEVGAVDGETMLPISQGITRFYIYGIDFENKKIKVFHKVYKETLFDELDLNKYKQKCLSGWALTKEELL